MYKLLMLPQLLVPGKTTRGRLAIAWLVSAAWLLLGALLALAVGRAHYARGLALLALGLAGWLQLVELGIAQALAPAQPDQPAAAGRWLAGWYCGFLLTQALGVAAGYVVCTATPRLAALTTFLF